jgi:hypothetical protein
VAQHEESLSKPEVASAYIRAESCTGPVNEEQLAKWREKIKIKEARLYIDALAQIESGDLQKAESALRELAKPDDGALGIFSVEAALKLVAMARSSQDLESVGQIWNSLKESEDSWQIIGRKIIARAIDFRQWDQAFKTGLRLLHQDHHDTVSLKLLIVAAKQSGQPIMARQLAQTLKDLAEPNPGNRSPAADDLWSFRFFSAWIFFVRLL